MALRRPNPRTIEWTAVSLLSLLFTAWAAAYIRSTSFVCHDGGRRYCLFDDAMISMRYAWNLAHGHGLVCNPGERVEGITNLLMTLLMAGPCAWLGKSAAVLAVQISGIAFVWLTAAFSWRVAVSFAADEGVDAAWLRILIFGATLAYYPLAFWSLTGMETGLLATLLSAAVLVAVRTDAIAQPSVLLSVLMGLAFLARPDAAVLIAVIAGYRVFGLWRRSGAPRTLAVEWLIVAAFVAGVSAFRWLYYGRWTPNTYQLKLGAFLLVDRLPNGLGFVRPFLESAGVVVLLAMALSARRPTRGKLLVIGLVSTATAYQIWIGGDPWRYWRQLAPVMPLFSGLLVVEIASALGHHAPAAIAVEDARVRGAGPLRRCMQPVVVTLAAAAAMAILNVGFGDEILLSKPSEELDYNHENVEIALALQAVTLPGATAGVSWAGAIPYYSELPIVDFLGKSDPHIAALPPDVSGAVSWNGMRSVPGHNKYDLVYSIKQRRPTYIQNYSWGRQNLRRWVAQHYVSARPGGTVLCLLDGSPYVDWRRLPQPITRGCDGSVVETPAAALEHRPRKR